MQNLERPQSLLFGSALFSRFEMHPGGLNNWTHPEIGVTEKKFGLQVTNRGPLALELCSYNAKAKVPTPESLATGTWRR